MMFQSSASEELFERLMDRGYPEPFCREICSRLNTDFTAGQMLGYLRCMPRLRLEDVVDEMLSILENRDRIIRRKQALEANGAWNRIMAEDFGDSEDLYE